MEYILAPGISRVFTERGIHITRVSQRTKVRRQGEEMEIDLLGIDGETVVAVEVKSTLSVWDVKYFLKTLQKFKEFFPEYAHHKVFGAVAGVEKTGQADKFAYC